MLHVFGDLDIFNAPELESAIAGSVRIGKLMVVNLLECGYIDSTIISVLLRARKALGNRLCVIVAKDGSVMRVLRLTNVDKVLRIVTTMVDAVLV